MYPLNFLSTKRIKVYPLEIEGECSFPKHLIPGGTFGERSSMLGYGKFVYREQGRRIPALIVKRRSMKVACQCKTNRERR